jgi:hypothetical protein
LSATTITSEQRNKIEEILRQLEQRQGSKEQVNRRGAPRTPLRASLTAHLISLPGHPTLPIHTRNISTSGIGFVCRRPFKKGELIAVEVYLVPHLAKMVLAETTFSRYVRDGMYEVGCAFRDSISRTDLLARYTREKVPTDWIDKALPAGPRL